MYGISEIKTLILIIKLNEMKTLTIENFAECVLSNEEMLNVRGGTSITPDDGSNPTRPPVIIEF
jgi:hypothetical protein